MLWREEVSFNVSPKLGSSGNLKKKRFKPDVFRSFRDLDSIFKFVCSDRVDLKEVLSIQETVNIPTDRVWIMPQGTSIEELRESSRRIVDDALSYGFNFSQRVHTTIWGDERGR